MREGGREEGGGAVIPGGKEGLEERRRGRFGFDTCQEPTHHQNCLVRFSFPDLDQAGGGVQRHHPGPNRSLPNVQVSHFEGVVTREEPRAATPARRIPESRIRGRASRIYTRSQRPHDTVQFVAAFHLFFVPSPFQLSKRGGKLQRISE